MFARKNKADYTYDYYHPNEPSMPIENRSSQFNPL